MKGEEASQRSESPRKDGWRSLKLFKIGLNAPLMEANNHDSVSGDFQTGVSQTGLLFFSGAEGSGDRGVAYLTEATPLFFPKW